MKQGIILIVRSAHNDLCTFLFSLYPLQLNTTSRFQWFIKSFILPFRQQLKHRINVGRLQ